MLTIISALLAMLVSIWLIPAKRLWEITTAQSLIIAATSTSWLFLQNSPIINPYFSVDEISSPLLILTCWLTTPTILASQTKMFKKPITHQRIYIFTIVLLQTTTLLAFLANNLMLFFIMFEATLIPTLIIITRWGSQKERMLAGSYLLFYTLSGSMALLTALLFFEDILGSLSNELNLISSTYPSSWPVWWSAAILAFLIKMPLYGMHLWLPKAHVEAPVAGSMVLAGTLLKLGGYGILRINALTHDSLTPFIPPLIIYSMLGVIISAALCSRQNDMKSLIAFSSISHMGLVIAASMTKTKWGITGSMILMISHGLISSALFCLANTSYERTNTRTLSLLKGSQIILPLLGAWWLMTTLLNMAMPPSSNFTGELMILTSMFKWSEMTLILAGLSIVFTTLYSLYLFWSSQREYPSPHLKTLFPSQSREHITLTLHLFPIIILVMKPTLM
uniref:NADH-ubiquinone oxidoreductase chain 4 n=1 Tax=Pristimantis fenestratus TaxID=448655 RepID=A0A0S2A2S5_9NEOB|nr:NADH dehydrogenase subunit 4 [Pristimantis fenestratus]